MYLLTSYPVAPPWSGADKNLARALLTSETGADFIFIGDRRDETAWSAQHQRRALNFATGIPTSREQLRLFGWLCQERVDIDLVHTIITFRPNLLKEKALVRLPLLDCGRLVVTCPSGHYLPRDLLRRASAAVAVSHKTETQLIRLGVPNVQRIPPGVDLDRFTPGTAQAAKELLGLSEQPVLLFAGHYDNGGGLDAALEVLWLIRQRVPSVRLITAMRPRPGMRDSQRRARLDARIRALGLTDSVVQLGSSASMPDVIRASAAVLYQPDVLGIKMDLPMVLLEALACGRPIVVSPADSLPELGDGTAAVMVGKPASGTLLKHVERLVTDAAYADSCGEAARRLALRRYSVDRMAAAYAALYATLLAERQPGPTYTRACVPGRPAPDGRPRAGSTDAHARILDEGPPP